MTDQSRPIPVVVNNYLTPYRDDLFSEIQTLDPVQVIYASLPEAKRREIGWTSGKSAHGVVQANDPAIRLGKSGRRMTIPLRSILTLARTRTDVVICTLSRDMVLVQFACLLMARLKGARLAYWVGDVNGPDSGGLVARIVDRLRLFCAARADGMIYYSSHSQDWLQTRLSSRLPRVSWIGGQVRHPISGPEAPPAPPRSAHPVLRVLVIGGNDPRKGIAQLIEDLSEIHAFTERRIELRIAGGTEVQRSTQRGVRVINLGKLAAPQMHSAYERSDVVVISSFREPWGFVLNEALLTGRACVVSEHAGSATVAERYHLAYRPGAPDTLQAAMIHALALPPEGVREIAETLSVHRAAASFHAFCAKLRANASDNLKDY